MDRLSIENLCFQSFGPVNLRIAKSESIGITGPSGAGKTLFLRAVADIDPHGGRVFLDGVHSAAIPGHEWRKKVGLLPSESAWWFDLVGDHFENAENRWFEVLGFNRNVLQWRVSRLSSGERQRLALLRLLCNRPKVLLLDEPTANLDSDNTWRVEHLLGVYQQERASALIWISHDTAQLKRVSSRRFLLSAGNLRAL